MILTKPILSGEWNSDHQNNFNSLIDYMKSFDDYNNYVKETNLIKEEKIIKYIEDQISQLNSNVKYLKDSLKRSISTELSIDIVSKLKEAESIIKNPSSIQDIESINKIMDRIVNDINKYESLLEESEALLAKLRDFLKIYFDDDRAPEALNFISELEKAIQNEDISSITILSEEINRFLQGKDKNQSTVNNDNLEASEESLKKDANGILMNSVVSTKYFDVKVTNATLNYRTGYNEFISSIADSGSQYLIITVQYENTDSESRTIFSGKLVAEINGKELFYDTAEIVMDEGFIILAETINPMATKIRKVAFMIPDKVADSAKFYYVPSRSKSRISLQINS